MIFKRILVLLWVVTMIVITGCSSTPYNLNQSSWLLTRLNGETLLPDSSIHFSFQNGTITGRDGCNQFSGSYTQDGEQLTIGPDLVSTMMACEETIMTQSGAFYEMLSKAKTFSHSDDTLILLNSDGTEIAVLEKQSTQLSNTSWIVTGYNNGKQAITSPIDGTETTIHFNQDGSFSGDTGCNTFSGTYRVDGDQLTISDTTMTLKACLDPDGIMEQESQFLAALNQADHYRLEDKNLEIRTASDEIAVTFTLQ